MINKDLGDNEKFDDEKFADTMLSSDSMEQAHNHDFDEDDDEANRLLFERGRRGLGRDDEQGDDDDEDGEDESYSRGKQRPFPQVDEQQEDVFQFKESKRRSSHNKPAKELDFSNMQTETAKR